MKHLKKLFNFGDNPPNYSNIKFDENFSPGLSLKKLREEFGIKQTKIYEDREVKQSHISNIELGNRYPDADTLRIYAEVLKLDYYDVLTAILNDYNDFLQNKAAQIEELKKALLSEKQQLIESVQTEKLINSLPSVVGVMESCKQRKKRRSSNPLGSGLTNTTSRK